MLLLREIKRKLIEKISLFFEMFPIRCIHSQQNMFAMLKPILDFLGNEKRNQKISLSSHSRT